MEQLVCVGDIKVYQQNSLSPNICRATLNIVFECHTIFYVTIVTVLLTVLMMNKSTSIVLPTYVWEEPAVSCR